MVLDLRKREKEILEYWKSHGTNGALRERGKGGKPFYFLDGPPYAYTELASHHLWVYSVKDLIVRYKRYRGFRVHDRPGFDVHGVPTENKVERNLKISSKADIESKIGVANFIGDCRKLAEANIRNGIETLTEFGVSLDFENVYVPFRNGYISKGWEIFKTIYDKGLVYRSLQPLAYCPHCETVLSAQGPEVEYADDSDPSIFVAFRIVKSKRSKVDLGADAHLVIWTTTPWTLPANMAIAANPKALYVEVKGDSATYVVAKERLEDFAGAARMNVTVLKEFYGSELDGVKYVSPLEGRIPAQKRFRKYHKVILSETFVTVSDGTGLLHVAPGHGIEDAKLGKERRIPFFSPVDEHARYTKDAGEYEGLAIPEGANERVLGDLAQLGALLFRGEVRHSYPHCWRCSSKLIYRSTEQWFINIRKIKRRMIAANGRVAWHPAQGGAWFEDAVESSPDWNVSRQRYWGIPMPIWICGSCGDVEVIGSAKALASRAGLEKEPADLHKPSVDAIGFKCGKCGGAMKRIPDIFDVWYDSGIAHTASLTDGEFAELFPADWITESLDQIRGWFSTLMRTGVAAYGKAPFRSVSIGGMLKDELGDEMHRHLGNSVSVKELLTMTSADGFRLWCLSHPRWQDLKLKKQEIVASDREVITLYNTAELVGEFAETAGVDTRVAKQPARGRLSKEDAWILSRLNSLIEETTRELDAYAIDEAVNAIRNFVIEDFSRFYLRLAKSRFSEGGSAEMRRIANITAHVLRNTVILASVVVPFSSEGIYQQLFSANGESVFMSAWPKARKGAADKELEREFGMAKEAITALLNSREKANVKLRWPLPSATIEVNDPVLQRSLEKFSDMICEYANVKRLDFKMVEALGRELKPVFTRSGPSSRRTHKRLPRRSGKRTRTRSKGRSLPAATTHCTRTADSLT